MENKIKNIVAGLALATNLYSQTPDFMNAENCFSIANHNSACISEDKTKAYSKIQDSNYYVESIYNYKNYNRSNSMNYLNFFASEELNLAKTKLSIENLGSNQKLSSIDKDNNKIISDNEFINYLTSNYSKEELSKGIVKKGDIYSDGFKPSKNGNIEYKFGIDKNGFYDSIQTGLESRLENSENSQDNSNYSFKKDNNCSALKEGSYICTYPKSKQLYSKIPQTNYFHLGEFNLDKQGNLKDSEIIEFKNSHKNLLENNQLNSNYLSRLDSNNDKIIDSNEINVNY